MKQPFTKYVQVSGLNAEGNVVIIGTNQPIVQRDGILVQKPLAEILRYISNCQPSSEVVDIKVEHKVLEGDYLVHCDPDNMTDLGLRYALAACFNWVDPVTNTEIFYKDGDVTVRGKIDILSLGESFQPFDPWTNRALAWEVMTAFGISIIYDAFGHASFNQGSSTISKYWDEPADIIRQMVIRAVNIRTPRKGASQIFSGHVPLSMVKPSILDAMQEVADAIGPNETAPDTGLAP